MLNHIIRQTITIILTIWLAVTLAFFALRLLPGNAIDAQLRGSGLPESVIEARKAELAYDQPMFIQYSRYILGLITGNWGNSLYTGQTVLEAISNRLPVTLSLASAAIIIAIGLGIVLGTLAGLSIKIISPIAQIIIDLSLGVPIYVTATLALFIVASRIGGIQTSLLLPIAVLGFHTSGAIARVIATNLKNIKQAPYIRTAQAKGLHPNTIIYRHILRLALLPAIPVIALQAGILFSGTVITESIFAQAGLGLLLLDATLNRDYPVVQGIVVLAAITYIMINHLAALTMQFLEPRLKFA